MIGVGEGESSVVHDFTRSGEWRATYQSTSLVGIPVPIHNKKL